MKKFSVIYLLVASFLFASLQTNAQQGSANAYFNLSSASDSTNTDYGLLRITAGKKTVLINSIIAYGENVKSLNITINDGFNYKLAPAQNGQSLNFIGTTINIVLQPGDKALINFTAANKGASARHIFLSGQKID